MIKKLLLLVFILSIANRLLAQCPPNIDFETGTLSNWQAYLGTVATGPIYTMTAGAPVPANHSITSGAGLDPYGLFPVVSPAGGLYSAKLGNTNLGAQAQKIVYYVHVPAGSTNYDFNYYYAIVMEDPGHLPAEQPGFEVAVYDSATGAPVTCGNTNFVSSATAPGFILSALGTSVYYKPWDTVAVHINGMAGQTIAVSFLSHDCTLSGHFGYAYVDIDGPCAVSNSINVNFCIGSAVANLSAPNGYASYAWYNSTWSTLLGITQALSYTPGSVPFSINCVGTTIGSCQDTFAANVNYQYPVTAAFSMVNDSICISLPATFTDQSTIGGGNTITNWNWDFGDPGSGASNTSTAQNPSHTFSAAGLYTVRLIASSPNGCGPDTVYHTIRALANNINATFTANNDTLFCLSDSSILTHIFPPIPGYTYLWSLDAGTVLNSGNLNSSSPIEIHFTTSGAHTVTLTLTNTFGVAPACLSNTYTQTLYYYPTGAPTLYISGNDSICIGASSTIQVTASPSSCGAASLPCTGTPHQVGTNNGTALNAQPTPFYGFYTEARCQSLYTAAELNAMGIFGGTINQISWNINSKASSAPYTGFTIKMACVPYTIMSALDTSVNTTTVYSNASYSTTLGVNSFTLSTPYNWDGVSSLLIDVCFDNGTSNYTSYDIVDKSITSATQCVYAYSDTDPLTGCDQHYTGSVISSMTASTERPDITLSTCGSALPTNFSYNWTSTPTGFTATTSTITVSPTVTTTYYVTASNSCVSTSQSFTVNVQNTPTYFPLTIVGNDTICQLGPQVLTVSGFSPTCGASATGCTSPTTTLIGNNNGSNSGVPTPFRSFWTESRNQSLYKATELTAQGMTAGTISEVSWNVLGKGSSAPFQGFTIKMACVTYDSITSMDLVTPLTTVYTNASYTTAVGVNNFVLSTPYNWDGTSNLLVNVCFDNGTSNYTNDDTVAKSSTANAMCVYAYSDTDPLVGCDVNYPGGLGTSSFEYYAYERPDITFKHCAGGAGSSAGYTFSWSSIPAGFSSSSASPTVSPTVTTTYIVNASQNCNIGIDSFVVYVGASTNTSVNGTVSVSNPYQLPGGLWVTTAGVYYDTLLNASGCDSVIITTLTNCIASTSSISTAICSNGSYLFGGNLLTTAGIYTDTLVSYTLCDSIVTLNLAVNPISTHVINQSICTGGTYVFNGNVLNSTGTYFDTLTNYLSCDSFITLNLSVINNFNTPLSQSICQGGSFVFNGNTLTTPGTYLDTLLSSLGCDSILTLTLTVNNPTFGTTSQSICAGGSYFFNGSFLTTPGNYNDTLTNYQSCDSILTLTLSVLPNSVGSFSQTICSNSFYFFNGNNLNTPGAYLDTLLNYLGCDSVLTLNLFVIPSSSSSFSQTICNGTTYLFNGNLLSASGSYNDTLVNYLNCDSIITLNLTVLPVINTNISTAICIGSTLNFNGMVISSPGVYHDTLTSYMSCDSFINLTVSFATVLTSSFNVTICNGASYLYNGINQNTSGSYLDTLQAAGGCDSVVTLNLTVLPILSSGYTYGICSGGSYFFNGQSLTSPGIYLDTLTTTLGCDSFITLNLVVNPTTASGFAQTICSNSSYFFNGQFLNSPGTYLDTLVNQYSCDSIITLTLSVKSISTSSFSYTMCSGNNYFFNGQLLTTGGIYYDTLVNYLNCDSIITLNLIVNPAGNTPISASICNGNSYLFNGNLLTAGGTYLDTLTTTGGCDSIITLTLSVLPASSSSISQSICSGGSYVFNGNTLSAAGTYTDTLTNTSGCDSIITLNLSVLPMPSPTNINYTACNGNAYLFNGQYLTVAGTYQDTLVSANGCDSVVTLNLATASFTFSVAHHSDTCVATVGAAATYQWIYCNTLQWVPGATTATFIAPVNDIYACIITANGCSDTSACLDLTQTGISTWHNNFECSLYPNPANDKVYIKTNMNFNKVVVYDLTGREVAMQVPSKNKFVYEMNTSNLPAGMHTLALLGKNDEKLIVKKLVIVK